jgi:hypothetical protein
MSHGGKTIYMKRMREFPNSFGAPCLQVLTADLLCSSCQERLSKHLQLEREEQKEVQNE